MSEQPSGLVVVDKPAGITSHDVVARVRRLAGTRKVGHAGTLDPMATGVLVLGVNRATRLLGHLMLTDKRYDATVRLGVTTSTDDAEGERLTSTSAADVGEEQVRAALTAYVGEIDQVPSAVSAIKVDGKRAYQRVRDGETVTLPARRVTVHDIAVHDVTPAGEEPALDVRLSVHCSSGTYIRAIARDLGEALGVGGHLTALRRTAVGEFDLATASTLEELAESFRMLGLDDAARRTFPQIELNEEQARAVRVGRPLELQLADSPSAVFAPDGQFLALYEQRGECARPVAVFTG
ncbi:tRNA pseudouridine(55) synthase TruB [Nocardioides sp.]|uniref:tRNA pseudouridine(55) synthase TruB n=1 Tax=Nocardioides sp. TaxID=35761 RepID=UPI002732C8C6|nr:tRNA pseudouridine(55) synthase TruB [Nocardioides sp.]MDP3890831.1 tRNA pseudouridine(55) synthase TruB [Nocardioides sp.]